MSTGVESPVIDTHWGRLRGVAFADKGVESFYGIPFAKPPIGPLRFRPPEPPEAWSGIRDATRIGAAAPQLVPKIDLAALMGVGEQSEDCLTLNVHRPIGASPEEPRPVMVWIHGGAFTIGSGTQKMYNPIRLLQRGGVVVVTINYRLGALGFLGLGLVCEEATSNPGLLDQVAALRWVRDEITAFGGDPTRVTIFGESAGGMSVGSLLGMPSAEGLFQRAIPMSGAAHAVASPGEAIEVAERFFGTLGVATGDVEALRAIDTDRLLAAQEDCETWSRRSGGTMPFQPVVSPESLPRPPIEAIASGCASDVAVMVGCTRDEWQFFQLLDPSAKEIDEAGLLERVSQRLSRLGVHADRAGALIDDYRYGAPDALGLDAAEISNLDLLCAIETDWLFRIPAIRLAEAQSRHQPDTYAYRFDWESPMLDGRLGACHGIDVPFIFGAIGSKAAGMFAGSGPEAETLCAATMRAWLSFAADGNPACDAVPSWPGYDTRRRSTMLFAAPCRVEHAPRDAWRELWDGLL